MNRSYVALLVALGLDNIGSGLFLPLSLVYATRVVGLSLSVAGPVVAGSTMVGLLVPPLAARLMQRLGPRAVVITAQVVQALGALSYLLAHGVELTVVAAVLLAAGQQLFYCSLFSLVADVSGQGPKDKPFAVVGMVRSACFGAGSLAAGGLLSWAGMAGCQAAVAANAVSFAACAGLLALAVRAPRVERSRAEQPAGERAGSLWHDRTYLALIGITLLSVLTAEFFLVGMPVYVLDVLRGPAWLPGTAVALQTAVVSIGATAALRATQALARTTAMALGTVLYTVSSLAGLAAILLPPSWQAGWLLGTILLLAAASLLFFTRVNALAEAAAPRLDRDRYLATFQYAFTLTKVLVPAVVSLFALGTWVPWLLVAASAVLAGCGLRWLTPRLPARALTPTPAAAANT